jgi:hypothetical protein
MGTRNKKTDEQPLFIYFVNCEFERKSISKFIKRVRKQLSPTQDCSSLDKSFQNKELFDACVKQHKNEFLEIVGKSVELGSKDDLLLDDYYWHSKYEYLSEKMHVKIDDLQIVDSWWDPGTEPWKDLGKEYFFWIQNLLADYEVIYDFKYLQIVLEKALTKIVDHENIEKHTLQNIQNYYNRGRTELIFGKGNYFEKINIDRTVYSSIVHEFVDFLCTADWKRLRQCPGACGGKYFVKHYSRKYHSDECSEQTEYKGDRQSGKLKERQKKYRKNKKGTAIKMPATSTVTEIK